jgi:glycosyltransferase involved in cell wall biosynthesis
MKILLVDRDYLPERVDGPHAHSHALARELAGRGHRVSALFSVRDPARDDGELRRGQLDLVRTIEVAHRREYADPREEWLEPRARKLFAQLLAEERPEIVHFLHLATWGAACMHVARAQGCAALYSAHDLHLLCANTRAMTDAGRLCLGGTGSLRPDCGECVGRDRVAAGERRRYHVDMLRRAQRVICPTQFVADVLRRNGLVQAEQIEVLAHGVTVAAAEPREREAGAALRVGFIGGDRSAEGAHVLAAALRTLGDAPIEMHRSGGTPDFYAGIDVLALPSLWYETAPLAIAEAFAHGVPVIATKLGGMAESVRDGVDGLLVARDDPAALASALRRVASEPGLLERLAQGIGAVPTIAATAERVEQLYVACRA